MKIKQCVDGYPSCRMAESNGNWCAVRCEAYEALDSEGRPYLRPPKTLGELGHQSRYMNMPDFVLNAINSIDMDIKADYGFGDYLYTAAGLNVKQAKNHKYSNLLLTKICDLPIKFMSKG